MHITKTLFVEYKRMSLMKQLAGIEIWGEESFLSRESNTLSSGTFCEKGIHIKTNFLPSVGRFLTFSTKSTECLMTLSEKDTINEDKTQANREIRGRGNWVARRTNRRQGNGRPCVFGKQKHGIGFTDLKRFRTLFKAQFRFSFKIILLSLFAVELLCWMPYTSLVGSQISLWKSVCIMATWVLTLSLFSDPKEQGFYSTYVRVWMNSDVCLCVNG